MQTLQQQSIASVIVPSGNVSMTYGNAMLKGITASQFARHAPGPNGQRVVSNHPAWVYGHLACYASRIMDLVGRPEEGARIAQPKFMDLFKNGTECKDDANATIYPGMDEIVTAWRTGYEHVLKALPEIHDEVLLRPNPAEGTFKQNFPTVGAAVAFLIAGHPMSHIGQVSAWRRVLGLPAAL